MKRKKEKETLKSKGMKRLINLKRDFRKSKNY